MWDASGGRRDAPDHLGGHRDPWYQHQDEESAGRAGWDRDKQAVQAMEPKAAFRALALWLRVVRETASVGIAVAIERQDQAAEAQQAAPPVVRQAQVFLELAAGGDLREEPADGWGRQSGDPMKLAAVLAEEAPMASAEVTTVADADAPAAQFPEWVNSALLRQAVAIQTRQAKAAADRK